MENPNSIVFKVCSSCKNPWSTREDFLADPGLTLIGYQAHFEELKTGLLYFNHTCGTTIVLDAGVFSDLYKGPVFEERLTGSEQCPGYCLQQSNLQPCPAQCECAFVREVMQIIKNWPKT